MKADLEQLENKGRLNIFQTAFVFLCIKPLFKGGLCKNSLLTKFDA